MDVTRGSVTGIGFFSTNGIDTRGIEIWPAKHIVFVGVMAGCGFGHFSGLGNWVMNVVTLRNVVLIVSSPY